MNTTANTTMSLKTRKDVKALAQIRAKQLGIPLGTLINAFLRNFGQTGEIHFTVAEPLTPHARKIIKAMEEEIANGETSGPFTNLEDAEQFLNGISQHHDG